jgi:hypothetical protein
MLTFFKSAESMFLQTSIHFYQSTRRHKPENTLDCRFRENVKFVSVVVAVVDNTDDVDVDVTRKIHGSKH